MPKVSFVTQRNAAANYDINQQEPSQELLDKSEVWTFRECTEFFGRSPVGMKFSSDSVVEIKGKVITITE